MFWLRVRGNPPYYIYLRRVWRAGRGFIWAVPRRVLREVFGLLHRQPKNKKSRYAKIRACPLVYAILILAAFPIKLFYAVSIRFPLHNFSCSADRVNHRNLTLLLSKFLMQNNRLSCSAIGNVETGHMKSFFILIENTSKEVGIWNIWYCHCY